MRPELPASIDAAAAAVRARLGAPMPRVALVLGSGLGSLTERITDPVRIPYGEIAGFPLPTVAGHRGELVAGTLAGTPVIAQSGRFHLYEGHGPEIVTFPVRVFGALGVTQLVLTNAAGGIRQSFAAGGLMLIADHINLTGCNPLAGPVLPGEERFPDLSDAYDPGLRALARDVAGARGVAIQEGVYAGLSGPSYETPAEVRMLERLGADAVGMSTVLEVIVARARGMRCLGVSTITNLACGLTATRLSHADVLRVAAQGREELGALVEGLVGEVGGGR